MKRPIHKALRSAVCIALLVLFAIQGQSQILDLLSTSPTVAYSLRQLKSSATRAIQVRRSSDNLTMDIGFIAGGDLNQATLLSFVGGNSGYITIWYDQSGNGHDAIQATAAKQPRIVNAGVIDVQNGRPICDFNGATSTMATSPFSLTTPLSLFLVNRRTGTGTSSTGYVTMFDGGNNNTFKVAYPNTSNPTSMGLSPQDWNSGTSLGPVPQLNSNSLFIYSALCDASGGVQYLNGGVQSHNFQGASASLNGIRLFRGTPLPADNELPAGQLSEVVLFGSKLSNSDRQMLECSESNYYAIQIIPAGLEFYVTSSAGAGCSQIKEEVAWQTGSLNNVQASGNNLTKYQSTSWDGGAASRNTVSDNGYLQFTANETNKARMIGLSVTHASTGYTTIQYAWYLTNGGALQIYESGSYRGTFGTYNTGDILRVAVESGVVKYYKNGVLQYISSIAPGLPLLVDVSIYDKGGTVTGATVTNYSSGVFTATAVNAGTSPGYQWLLNGNPVGANSNTYTNTSLVANDVVSCVLTPNIAGCGTLTLNSNNLTDSIGTPPIVDLSIQGTAAGTSCSAVVEQVEWNLSTLSTAMNVVSTNSLSKFQINGWNGGAASWNTVSNNGYFQFTASETNKSRMAGLSASYTGSNYTNIQYAFYLTNGGSLQIYESGSSRGGFGTYTTGDILKIAIEAGVVKYYKNGSLLYISQAVPALPMLVDVSINDAAGTISNALVSNYNAGVFTANAVNAGISPTYQWLLNGAPVGTNSNTYTNTSLNNNDVLTCTMTPNLSGCNNVPLSSNSITQTVIPPANMDFSIQGVAATTNCNSTVEQVKWKLANTSSNMTVLSGNSLSKFQSTTGGWDCATWSWNTVSNNGYFQFTATETNKTREAGLSANYINTDYTTIQYGFYLNSGGGLQVVESGSNRGTFGSYATGDILKIAVESNVVKYYQNGNLVYISGVAPTLPLSVDVALNNVGSSISNALVGNYNAGAFIANTVNAGAAPTFQWMVNGVTMQTGTSATYANTALNSSDVVTCVMIPGLAGCNTLPVTSNTIMDTIIAPANVDFSIQGVGATTNCSSVIEQVKWNLSNTTNNMTVVSTNGLSKFQSNGWDGGAASWNTVSNNGYFQFTATETNTSRMAGLSTSYTGSSYTTIQYAFYLTSGGTLQIYESGSGLASYGPYSTGDVLKIAVEGGIVKYYKNGVLLYISAATPTLPLLVDVSMYHPGATISNAQVFNYNAGVFVANTTNAGANPTFQWMVNGVIVQTGLSPTYTNTSINNGDFVTCQMTPDLAGCVAVPIASNAIKDTVVAPLNMDFSIQGASATSNCNSVIEQVKWRLSDLSTGMTISAANNLSRFQSNGWNCGVSSWNTVSNNGYFQFTVSETNTYRAIGLSNSYTGSNYTNIQYCFYLNNGGALQINESGSGRGTFGTYATGDILKITVESNVVKYYKNGTLLYISNVAPTLPLLVDASIYSVNGTITNAIVSNYNAGTFVANTVNAGATPTFQWMVNGVAVQTGVSATYTNTGLANNDVVTCLMTPGLAGCNAVPVASNTIKDTVIAPINVDFSIQGVAATTNCNSVIEQVKWNLSNTTNNMTVVSTNSLSKFQSNAWDGGTASWNTVSNNGYFQFTVSETNTYRAIGLSSSYTGSSFTNIQYCFYLNSGGALQIDESNSGRGTFGTYTTGDILKIAVENNVVKYYRNGVLLYISNATPALPLLVHASIYSVNGTITNALVSNYNAGSFIANTANAGANPIFQWMVNGVTVQTGTSAAYTNTGLTNNDVVTCLMTPDLTGCVAVPIASNSIKDTLVGPPNLDFSIQGTPATSNCNAVVEQVKWKLSDLSTNLLIAGMNGLSKFQSGGWNSGVSSWNTVSNNGYFQFTATETNKSRMAGLSTSYTGSSYTTIQYAFYLVAGGSLQVFESGSGRGSVGTYTTGDVLKIAVEANTVKYYKNGTLLYISSVAPTLPMLVDVSINDVGGTIGNALVSNYNAGVFTANTVNAGANPTFQWKVNGTAMQTGASATYTNASLNNGDVVTCILTPDLAGCNATTTYTSNTIIDSVSSPVNLDFSIQGTASSSNCRSVIEQVKWKLSDLNNNLAIISTNSLSRFQNSGWTAGASSWNTVSNNGYFQFTANETNTSRMAGLSTSFAGNNYTTIQYAFYLIAGGSLGIYESGNYRGTFGTYATGDVFKITVESNVVKYYKNGAQVYISTVTPILPLLVDVSINSSGGTIGNALVSNYNAGVFTANTANAGANPIFQWMVNGVAVQTGVSAIYTATSINNGDFVTCVLTPDLSGCNAGTTYTSNTITNTTAPPLNLDFSILGTAGSSNCASVTEQVKWKLSNLSPNITVVSMNNLSKFQSNAWDGGAASWNTVSNNGYFQFTASETNTNRAAGLSASYTSTANTTIQYAFQLGTGGALQVYESGSNKGTFGTYATGDILKIAVENNVVKYYKNGALLYISGVTPSLPLLVDVSIKDVGGTISSPLVSNYSTGVFTANAVNAGTNPTFQWMVNGVTVQTGTGTTYTNTGLSNNDVITCTLTPDLPGCSVTPYNSNTITNIITAPLNLDFSIQGVVDPSSCAAVVEQVKWKLSNLSPNMNVVSVNGLSKFQSNGVWDGGASSWNMVSNNGYFQFTASEINTSRMAGLSTNYAGSNYTTIQYAFYLVSGGSLQIYESGSSKGAFGTYTTGDILKISVENNVVKYYRNGALLRTSTVTPTLPMLVDVSISNVGGTITNAMVSNLNSGSFVANAVNAGTFPNYQWMVNGVTVQNGLSASYTNTSISNGDVVTCTLTPNLPGCVAATFPSNTVTYVKSGSTTTWTGATSNSWFTASNWSGGIPDRFTSAVIAAGTPNNPVLSSDASVYDLTINSGATLTVSGSPILYIYRNFTNNGTFTPGTGTVDFVGCSAPAVINSAGTETFYNLMINTPYGVTIASGTQQVSKLMTFVTGIVTQNATLTFLNGSGVSGATDGSHVNGVVTKVGTGAFTFPVGDNTSYRPIAISSPGSATDVFTAQYIRADAGTTYPRSSRDATLNQVSQNEYWMLNRTNGTSNVTVNLSWNVNSGTIVNLGGLHVTGWNTAQTKWKDLGSSGTTGNASGGTVTSGAPVTAYGPFTLSSLTTNNVLPVQLLYFHCDKINTSLVDLSWSTANEQNSDYFMVERSADGSRFDPIATVPAAGNSSLPLTYTTKDSHPLKGISYYRLKLTDLDGSSIYSEVRVINVQYTSELTVFPNPATDKVFVGLNDNHALKVSVVDNTGREVLSALRPTDAVFPIDVSRLAAGLYFVVIDLEDKTRVTKKLLIKR